MACKERDTLAERRIGDSPRKFTSLTYDRACLDDPESASDARDCLLCSHSDRRDRSCEGRDLRHRFLVLDEVQRRLALCGLFAALQVSRVADLLSQILCLLCEFLRICFPASGGQMTARVRNPRHLRIPLTLHRLVCRLALAQ